MKKILLSLGTLVVVGAIVAGATIAFYNDTETSTGNIFVAGSIDLKVDHLAQTYNGVDCETCSLTLYSADGNTDVVDSSNNATIQNGFPFGAPDITPHPAWATHGTADWIWATDVGPGPYGTAVGDDGTNGNVSYTFERTFNWWGDAVDLTMSLDIGADNSYALSLNGVEIVPQTTGNNYNPLDPLSAGEETAFLAELVPGENTLTIIVTNHYNPDNGGAYNNPTQNPGGLLYYLNIERDQEDCNANSEFQQACMLWTETDLDGSQTFFNFGDVKPADWGTNLISLHVTSNDAFACLFPNEIVNGENNLIEPEDTAGDITPNQPDGELSQFIKMFAWDDDGDGVYEGETTLIPVNTPLDTVDTEIIAMNLQSSGVDYIGLAWCVGTQTLPGGNVIACSGSASGIDQAQTDSVTASLTAYAVQQRNNEGFDCESVLPLGN